MLPTLATTASTESPNWCAWTLEVIAPVLASVCGPCPFDGDGGGVGIDLMYSMCHLVPHCSEILDRHDRERPTFNV